LGLVPSNNADTFGGLLIIKDEPKIENHDLHAILNDDPDHDVDSMAMVQQMDIDPSLLTIPQSLPPMTPSASPSSYLDRKQKLLPPIDLVDDSDSTPTKRIWTSEDSCMIDATVNTIFKPCQLVPSPQSSIDTTPLLLPPGSLTRSQLVFSLATDINPQSLSILTCDEFFLFMDMHCEQGWASFKMTSHKWVLATNAYNERLQQIYASKGQQFIRKKPHALMDKLGNVEQVIAQCIATNNYCCKSRSNLLSGVLMTCMLLAK
jgi:hypothetical protein